MDRSSRQEDSQDPSVYLRKGVSAHDVHSLRSKPVLPQEPQKHVGQAKVTTATQSHAQPKSHHAFGAERVWEVLDFHKNNVWVVSKI